MKKKLFDRWFFYITIVSRLNIHLFQIIVSTVMKNNNKRLISNIN